MNSEQLQWSSDLLAQNERFRSELVQLARFGAKGDSERVRIQVMRFIRTLRAAGDDLADTLQAAAFQEGPSSQPTRSSPVRRAASHPSSSNISSPVPTDMESRLDLLRVEDPPSLPHAIIQNAQTITQIDQLVLERRSVTRLAKLGLPPPKAVLFTGPPGVGKTMAARHIAIQLRLPLLVLDLATVMSSYLGKSGNNIKQSFRFARERPCVFFLDELDAVGKRRDDDGDIGELKRLVTVLLQELDLWQPDNLLLAATNHEQIMDAAILRRFDDVVAFPRPAYGDLRKLGSALIMEKDPLPTGWAELLAHLDANTSQSSFVRDMNRLRRAFALGGRVSGLQVLMDIANGNTVSLPKAERKRFGLSLIKIAGLSQREASQVAGIARETLRTTIKQEA